MQVLFPFDAGVQMYWRSDGSICLLLLETQIPIIMI